MARFSLSDLAHRRRKPAQIGIPGAGSDLPGAALRAALVVLLAVFPVLSIPFVSPETAQSFILLSAIVGLIVFAEYASKYPGLIEFRRASPFNRTRFAMLALMVILLSLLQRDLVEPGFWSGRVADLAAACGELLDFPQSPVCVLTGTLPDTLLPEDVQQVRDGAALALVIAVVVVIAFIIAVMANLWPMGHEPFNVWINLPTFYPTVSDDVVKTLRRSAILNIVAGVLLPFALPGVIYGASIFLEPISLASPLGYVWGIVLWAYFPASLVMRGVAMAHVASMIRASRHRGAARDKDSEPYATA